MLAGDYQLLTTAVRVNATYCTLHGHIRPNTRTTLQARDEPVVSSRHEDGDAMHHVLQGKGRAEDAHPGSPLTIHAYDVSFMYLGCGYPVPRQTTDYPANSIRLHGT